MILDSNILIYSTQPSFQFIRDFISNSQCATSEICRLEVLGYYKIKDEEKALFQLIFTHLTLFQIDKPIIEKAIEISQLKSISIGDSLVAATAIVHLQPLVTRNETDFAHIKDLKIINPFV